MHSFVDLLFPWKANQKKQETIAKYVEISELTEKTKTATRKNRLIIPLLKKSKI